MYCKATYMDSSNSRVPITQSNTCNIVDLEKIKIFVSICNGESSFLAHPLFSLRL